MVVSRKRRRTEKRRGATAGEGMHWGVFREVTGASRESVLAEGDCADVVAAPGRVVTWEALNLIRLPLHVSPHPPIPFFPTNTQEYSFFLAENANTHRQTRLTSLYTVPLQTLPQRRLCLCSLAALSVASIPPFEFITETKLIVTAGIVSFNCSVFCL